MPGENGIASKESEILSPDDIEARLKVLPEDVRKQVLEYMEFLLSKHQRRTNEARDFRFDWAGGLADLADKYTPVALQHKASEWR